MAPIALAAMMATESDGVTKNLHSKEKKIIMNLSLQLSMILNTKDARDTQLPVTLYGKGFHENQKKGKGEHQLSILLDNSSQEMSSTYVIKTKVIMYLNVQKYRMDVLKKIEKSHQEANT